MTCPIDELDEFLAEHWDVDSLCELMPCSECTAEPGEGAQWVPEGPPGGHSWATEDYDDIPF